MTREKGVDLLADAFLRARRSEPRLHLLLAGGGPEEGELRERLGDSATFLGWLEGEDLARAYASADMFLFCSRTDTYGQVVLEAGRQRAAGDRRRRGRPGDPGREQPHRPPLPGERRPPRRRPAAARLHASASPPPRGLRRRRRPRRSWERSLEQLAAGYGRALGGDAGGCRQAAGSCRLRQPGRPGAPQYDDWIDDPALYFNRELSWLDFNQRVLELAEDPQVPLLERVRFCSIYASNLDEFFMVRVAGLFDQLEAGIDARGPDGLGPAELIEAIQARVLELDRRLHRCFEGTIRPQLEEERIRIVSLETATEDERREIDARFHDQVFPALTPLVIGLGRPFPYISNLSLSLGVLLRDPDSATEIIARVKVPKELLGRFLRSAKRGGRPSSRSRRRSPPTSTRCSPAPRSSTTAISASPATPTSPSPTRPTTSSRPSRTNSAAVVSARS